MIKLNAINTIIYFLFAMIIMSCTLSKRSNKHFANLIKGEWESKNENDFFTTINISKSGVVVYNTGDTLLRYAFGIRKNDLLLRDANAVETYNKIIKLTNDSLVFANLFWHEGVQIYVRIK